MASALTKSKLISRVARQYAKEEKKRPKKKDEDGLTAKDIELAVKTMIDCMADTMAEGGRIEIRGFGSFSLHFRAPRVGRNPKTGASVKLHGKYVPHFKSGKELRERVNESLPGGPGTTPAGGADDDRDNDDRISGEAANG